MVSLACPQCGGALPRQARWRMVSCPFCAAMVTRSEDVVLAATFREAWLRAQAALAPADRRVRMGKLRYRILAPMGGGELSEVFLAERISPFPERVTLKLARAGTPAGALAQEAQVLRDLQAIDAPGSAYFSQRLPQVAAVGKTEEPDGREALILRHPVGFWGSLDAVMRQQPGGIDPRHAVWMWRRILEVLGFIHDCGWAHGDVCAEHMLVHPRDHGILLIGWRRAQQRGSALQARDLVQAAWSIRALLTGGKDMPAIAASTPAPLAAILRQASEDSAWCARLGAAGIDQALKSAAREAFGPPQFVPFHPLSHAV